MTNEELLQIIKQAARNKAETLDLSGKGLTTLPAEIGQLTNLRVLYLSNNQLTRLPAVIGQLINLSELDLIHNQLTRLPAEIGQLTNLEILDLKNNQLISLPPQIQVLTKLRKLDLRGEGNSKLQIPPEIIGGDSWDNLSEPSNILRYYFSLQVEEKKPLNEAKVLLVGQGGVGKTSLVKRLLEDLYDPLERKTEGINIKNWQISVNNQSIRLNVWDFGGQEIMHATHQFFLTKRSLYLLVINARRDEQQNELEYWLKIIQSFGGDSPIILVGNKNDEHPLDIDQRGLRNKYPAIRHIVSVSCETKDGLDNLRLAINNEIAQLKHIYDPLPKSWFEVKTHLEQIEQDYIPYKEYEHLCGNKQVTDRLNQSILIDLLHNLGTVLNFSDDPRLKDTHVLNPEWVTNGVYKILNDNRLMTQYRGILDSAQLKRILNDSRYPDDKQLFIVDMMRKFELCFPLEGGGGEDRFLIPDLLPKEQPATGEWKDILSFQYHYNILPSSVISRFIVRMHDHSDQQTWWRSGIVLKYDGNRALVKSDTEDRKIFISISGSSSTRRELLAMIRSQFYAIHQTIKGLEVKEKVGIPKHPNNVVVDYQTLLQYEKQGLRIIPDGLQESFDPRQLLDGIESIANRRKSDIPKTQNNMSDNQQPENNNPSPQNSPAERGIALGMAVIVLTLFVVLVLYPRATESGTTLAIIRFLAATFAGIAGYLFAGTLGLEAQIPLNKSSIKATGAFAAFIIVLFLFFYGIPASQNSVQPKPISYNVLLNNYY